MSTNYSIDIDVNFCVSVNANNITEAEISAKNKLSDLLFEIENLGKVSYVNGGISLNIRPEQYQDKLEEIVMLIHGIYSDEIVVA